MSKTDLTTSSSPKSSSPATNAADFIYQSISKSTARNSETPAPTATTTTSPAAADGNKNNKKSSSNINSNYTRSPIMIPPAQQTSAELIPVRPGLKRERTSTGGSNRSGLLSMDLGFIRSDEIAPDGGLSCLAGGSGRSIASSDIVRDLIENHHDGKRATDAAEAFEDGSCADGSYSQPLSARDEKKEACPVAGLAQQLGRITTGESVVPLDGVMRITSADWVRDFGAEQSGGIGAMHPSMFGGPPVTTSMEPAVPAPVPSAGGYDEYDAPLRQSPPASAAAGLPEPSLSRAPPLPGTSPSSQTTSSTKRRRRKKKRVIDVSRSVEYTDDDVLFGRGGFANKHPGNVRFRARAMELRPWYESVSKEEKYNISDLLVESVKAEGHRFLEKGSDGLWHEVIGNGARKKASQALRERIKGKRGKGRQGDLGDSAGLEGPAADGVRELIGNIEPAPVEVENVVGV